VGESLRRIWGSQSVWIATLTFFCFLRVFQVTLLQNPVDVLFSDPARHWDNAKNFLTPGPMGCSNAFLYQAYLFGVQYITGERHAGIALVTSALSLLLPLSWSLFAGEVLRSRLNVLRFVTVVSALPTFSFMYMFFMAETLLLPLLGLSLWLSWRSVRLQSGLNLFGAILLWLLCILTRPVVLPVALVILLWAIIRIRGRILPLALATVLSSPVVYFSAEHSYEHFYSYSPVGHDGSLTAVAFLSGAKTWVVRFTHGYWYIYESPSFSIPPFWPFSEWKGSREGKFEFAVDREKRGQDLTETAWKLAKENAYKLPRFVLENQAFLLFGHSWPDAHTGRLDGYICLWEKWIWFPLFLLSVWGSLSRIYRTGRMDPFDLLLLSFTLVVCLLQVNVLEGRYRKPVALIWLLGVFKLFDRESEGIRLA